MTRHDGDAPEEKALDALAMLAFLSRRREAWTAEDADAVLKELADGSGLTKEEIEGTGACSFDAVWDRMEAGEECPNAPASVAEPQTEYSAALHRGGGEMSSTALAELDRRRREALGAVSGAGAGAVMDEKVTEIEALVAEVLDACELEYPPVPVEDICRCEGISILPADYHGAFDSRIEYHSKENRFLLFVDKATRGKTEERRRFSTAHELGHFYLPEHREILLGGAAHDSATEQFSRATRIEAEADEFAARLLMPTTRFRRAMRDVGVREMRSLAGDFLTSWTATAHRMIEETSKACSVVFSDGTRVRYAKHSEEMRLIGLWGINHGDQIPSASRTAIFARTGALDKASAEVGAHVWYKAERQREGDRKVWEEVASLGDYGFVTFLVYEGE